MDEKALSRFFTKVDIQKECWVWTASTFSNGYGQFKLDGKNLLAHRVSYSTFVAPLQKGMVIDHLCRNRICVRPEHLEQVTSHENVVVRGETVTAKNNRKENCLRGHPLSGDNLHIDPSGRRRCRGCNRLRHLTPESRAANRRHQITYRSKSGDR